MQAFSYCTLYVLYATQNKRFLFTFWVGWCSNKILLENIILRFVLCQVLFLRFFYSLFLLLLYPVPHSIFYFGTWFYFITVLYRDIQTCDRLLDG